MQAHDSGISWRARREKLAEPSERNGLDPMTIASNHGCGHGQRIHNRFLCRFDGRRNQRIHAGIGEVRQRIGRLFRIVRDHVRRGEGENEVAAAMASC